MKRISILLFTLALLAQAQEMATVTAGRAQHTLRLPAEILPYQAVDLHPRVTGFVERVNVDRGSMVKKGQTLVEMSAPELTAQLAAIESKALAIESRRAEARAKLTAAESTSTRLNQAASTPGAIAGNELVQAKAAVDAVRAEIVAIEKEAQAARAAAPAVQEMVGFLRVTAPFDGVITERNVHPGALVGPTTDTLLRLEQLSRLRVVVAVPENAIGGIAPGARVPFTVAGGVTGVGVVARVAHSLDQKTRTMPVEMDVNSVPGLAPGMYAEVKWPVRNAQPSMLVPRTSVVTTTERVFVIRNAGGKAEYVDVKKGEPSGESIEVFGNLKPGDAIVKRGSDEIREGTALRSR